MGPKTTKCEIQDQMEHVNLDDYISTLTTTRTPDVPSGGVFSVKTRTCIMWAGPLSTKVIVTTQVDWTGRSYIRGALIQWYMEGYVLIFISLAGIIERSAIAGQKVYHTDLEKAMRAYIQEHHTEFVPEGAEGIAEEPIQDEKPTTSASNGEASSATGQAEPEISQAERDKLREKERNQRAFQWAFDTFEDVLGVVKRSGKGLLDLVNDAWDQSSSTTILYFVIVILVLTNIYTLIRMNKKVDVGRRKEVMQAEERERWVQSVVMTLWEELAAGKKEAAQLRQQYLERPTSNAAVAEVPASSGTPSTPGVVRSWREEVDHLHTTLGLVEERIKAIKQSLVEFEKIDTLD